MSDTSPHRHYAECGSTNDIARTWVLDSDDPAPHGALVTADFQTSGRGRRGRTWDAAPGQNLLLSAVARPQTALADAWQLGFLAGVAVADVLAAHSLAPRLKWPNDVLLDGNKVAGILVETVLMPNTANSWAAIIGIGLNVNQSLFDRPERLLYPATSLRRVTGRRWDVPGLTPQIGDALETRITELEQQGWESIRDAWRRGMATDITLQRGQEQGLFINLESDGSARIRRSDGTFARWASVERGEEAQSAPDSV